MRSRSAAVVSSALLLLFALIHDAEAQRQTGKLGGGAGFAWLSDPDVDLGSTAALGGFIGYRFNDNVSVEGGLYFVRSNRVFSEDGIPVDQTPDIPAFRFETTRFHADGVLVLNLGRRQPFHPFVLLGAGVERRDDKQSEFDVEVDENTGLPVALPGEVVLDQTEYLPTAVVGGGAEIYFMYNLAARAEFRLWVPKDWSERTHTFFFSASFYF